MSKKSITALLGIGLVSIGLLYQFWGREFIAQDRCLDAGGAYQQATQSCDHSMDDIAYDAFDGVTYYGVVDGKSVSLEIIGHGDGYRMSVDGQVTLGELNTERGFEQDENASLFILNWRQQKSSRSNGSNSQVIINVWFWLIRMANSTQPRYWQPQTLHQTEPQNPCIKKPADERAKRLSERP